MTKTIKSRIKAFRSWRVHKKITLDRFAQQVGAPIGSVFHWNQGVRPGQLWKEKILAAFPDCPIAK